MLDPDFAANILSHAFKGVQVTTSAASSPRMIRTAPPSSGEFRTIAAILGGAPMSLISDCAHAMPSPEFPFLREDETKRAVHQPPLHDATAPAFLASPRADAVPILASEQQLQAHMLKMSAMSTMSSFHGDNPFSGASTAHCRCPARTRYVADRTRCCFVSTRVADAVRARRRVPRHGGLAPGRLECAAGQPLLDEPLAPAHPRRTCCCCCPARPAAAILSAYLTHNCDEGERNMRRVSELRGTS